MSPGAGPVHLVADAVSVGYPGRAVLDQVDLLASAGHRVGVVGENGAGKTTLLRVLAGDLAPFTGEVRRAGSVAVVEQELGVGPGATVGTLVAEALGRSRAAAERLDGRDRGVRPRARGPRRPSRTPSRGWSTWRPGTPIAASTRR